MECLTNFPISVKPDSILHKSHFHQVLSPPMALKMGYPIKFQAARGHGSVFEKNGRPGARSAETPSPGGDVSHLILVHGVSIYLFVYLSIYLILSYPI